MAGWAPDGEGEDLEGDVGELGRLDEAFQLAAHDLAAPNGPAQGGLIDHRPQPRRVLAGQQDLAGHPQPHPPAHLVARFLQMGAVDHRAHVVVGLQQPGDELAFVAADQGGGLFQVDIGAEPAGEDVAVVLPPAGGVGFSGQGEEFGDFGGVGDLVAGQQVDDVAVFEADLAVLEAVDLPF